MKYGLACKSVDEMVDKILEIITIRSCLRKYLRNASVYPEKCSSEYNRAGNSLN